MGLFGLFKKKPKKTKETQALQMTTPLKMDDVASREEFVTDCCKTILEVEQQNQEAKSEYQLVTAYLSDIQRIDVMSLQAKSVIEDAAKKVLSLNQERASYEKQEPKITEAQKAFLRQYEEVVPKEIEKLKKEEEYQRLVQTDMKHLEGEKATILMEREELLEKNTFLRKLSVVLCALVLVFICVFLCLQHYRKVDLQIPFLLTVILGLCGAIYIMSATRKTLYQLKVSELKMKKLITLLNKIKLKYINCTSTIEYVYEKYHIESAMQFAFMWQEYVRIKEEEAKFRKNADLISRYQKTIIDELKKQGLEDPNIWAYQPIALIDSKEMVEVRHRLNVRRQKLREKIDFNFNQAVRTKEILLQFMRDYPEYEQEARKIVNRFRIPLDFV